MAYGMVITAKDTNLEAGFLGIRNMHPTLFRIARCWLPSAVKTVACSFSGQHRPLAACRGEIRMYGMATIILMVHMY